MLLFSRSKHFKTIYTLSSSRFNSNLNTYPNLSRMSFKCFLENSVNKKTVSNFLKTLTIDEQEYLSDTYRQINELVTDGLRKANKVLDFLKYTYEKIGAELKDDHEMIFLKSHVRSLVNKACDHFSNDIVKVIDIDDSVDVITTHENIVQTLQTFNDTFEHSINLTVKIVKNKYHLTIPYSSEKNESYVPKPMSMSMPMPMSMSNINYLHNETDKFG